jgi:hypothetical protein
MHGSQISGFGLPPPVTYVYNRVVMIGHRCPYSVSKPLSLEFQGPTLLCDRPLDALGQRAEFP